MHLVHTLCDDTGAGIFAGLGIIMIVFWLIGAALTIFWIWMLIDCLTRAFPSNEKLIWMLVIVLLGPLGAILYFLIARPKGGVATTS
jgi:hypothetical protein